jgi:hypothetical protein
VCGGGGGKFRERLSKESAARIDESDSGIGRRLDLETMRKAGQDASRKTFKERTHYLQLFSEYERTNV